MEDKDLTFKDILKELDCGKTKFFKDVDLICEAYGIDRGKFKKAGMTKDDYYRDENSFLFRKEWKDVAKVLFFIFKKNPYYSLKKTECSANLDEIVTYYKTCFEKINDLPEEDKQIIQSSDIYTATFVEAENLRTLNDRLNSLILIAAQQNTLARSRVWANLIREIDNVLITMIYDGLQDSEEIKNNFDVKRFLEYYCCSSLDQYLAFYLENKIDATAEQDSLSEDNQKRFANNFVDYKDFLEKDIDYVKDNLSKMNQEFNEYIKKKNAEFVAEKYRSDMTQEQLLFLLQDSGEFVGNLCITEGREIILKSFELECKINKLHNMQVNPNNDGGEAKKLPGIIDISNLSEALKAFLSNNNIPDDQQAFLTATVDHLMDILEPTSSKNSSKSIFDKSNFYINNRQYSPGSTTAHL